MRYLILSLAILTNISLANPFDVIEGEDLKFAVNFPADLATVLEDFNRFSELQSIYPKRFWEPVFGCVNGLGKECRKLFEYGERIKDINIATKGAKLECAAIKNPSCENALRMRTAE